MITLKNKFKVLETPKIKSVYPLFQTMVKNDIIEVSMPITEVWGESITIKNLTRDTILKCGIKKAKNYFKKIQLKPLKN